MFMSSIMKQAAEQSLIAEKPKTINSHISQSYMLPQIEEEQPKRDYGFEKPAPPAPIKDEDI